MCANRHLGSYLKLIIAHPYGETYYSCEDCYADKYLQGSWQNTQYQYGGSNYAQNLKSD